MELTKCKLCDNISIRTYSILSEVVMKRIKWIPFIGGMTLVCVAGTVLRFAVVEIAGMENLRAMMQITKQEQAIHTFLMALSGITVAVIFFQLGRRLIVRGAK